MIRVPPYLWIDVGERRAEVREYPAEWAERFVGGTGLAVRLLYERTPACADPLGPENAVVFATGPLVGTPVTTTSKFAIAAKSPLTERIGDSLSSSHFAVELRRTGLDAIAIAGRSEEWIVVVIENDRVAFEDARAWLGRPAAACARDGFRVAAIGPAGERLVRYATISADGRHAGRGGLGAVLGAKRVKAVAVRGTRDVRVADPERLERIAEEFRRRSLGPATAKYRKIGTIANLPALARLGALPVRNFGGAGDGRVPDAGGLRHVGREFCAHCTIGCTHLFEAQGAPVRIEYETAFALGPLVGVDDARVLAEAARICDELGMDTISAGGTIAWAMECAERGVLDGPRFGDAEGLRDLLRAIGRREGLGDLLAEGSRRAAAGVGRGSEEWAMHVKGMEIPGYDARALPAMALGYAVGARGACHNRSGAYEVDFGGDGRDPVAGAIETEDRMAVMDSLIVCKFLRGCFRDFYAEAAEMLEAAAGRRVDLREAGARIVDLKKAYNEREGWTPEEDRLPSRLDSPEVRERVRAYYRARGWTDGGRLCEERRRDLGLASAYGSDFMRCTAAKASRGSA